MRIGCTGCLVALIVIVVTIFSIFFLTFTFGRLLNPNSPPRQAAERMEEHFQRDKESFFIIRNYLIDMRYEYSTSSITIGRGVGRSRFDGTVFVGLEQGSVPIENESVLSAIRQLFANGYSAITIKYNYISFQRWSTLNDGWGALYLIEGEEPSGTAYVATILESLSEDGWYFYRSG